MKRILVVGAGNFGSWWIVGLHRCLVDSEITAFDTRPEGFSLTQERVQRVPLWLSQRHQLSFTSDACELAHDFDLVIVATTADRRLQVVEQLSKQLSATVWILEKVLTQSAQDLDTLINLLKNQRVYVNHSRRLQPQTEALRVQTRIMDAPKSVTVLGGRWEMASNSFHYVDLLHFLFGGFVESSDASGLSQSWHASSTRKGFLDVRGRIVFRMSEGPDLILDWSKPTRSAIQIHSESGGVVSLEEVSGELSYRSSSVTPKKLLALVPLIDFSELAPLELDKLLATGHSGLPTLDETYRNTRSLLNVFASHYRQSTDGDSQVAPIS